MAGQTNSSEDLIHFLRDHRPALADGSYELTVLHRVSDSSGIDSTFAPSNPLAFDVAGARFSLLPSEVAEIFPPKGSRGDFSEVLPHVVLNRGTLPWERSADSARDGSDFPPPWVALLVFAPGEVSAPVATTASALKPPAGVHAPEYPSKPGDIPDTPVTVIRVRWSVLRDILPSVADLPHMAHARRVNDGETRAVVIANRLPAEGQQMTVHLVSVEHLYADGKFFVQDGTGDQELVQLVSLYSWDFFCQKDTVGHFRDLMKDLRPGPFRLDLPGTDQPARRYLQGGFVPLRHRFRQGDRSVSWYHGPLLPMDGVGNVAYHSGVADPFSLPARSADALLLYDQSSGMLDVSYAAAWELGRQLILQNSRIATMLFQWKRQRALDAASIARAATTAHFAGTRPAAASDSSAALDEKKRRWNQIRDWFGTQLDLLEGVPFQYLVPDPQYLPPSTLRFFALDPLWIRSLRDGAFSIGRFGPPDFKRDVEVLQGGVPDFALPDLPRAAGFWLRSPAVAGFPSLLTDVYFSPPKEDGGPPASEDVRYTVLRSERVGDDVLLVLFDLGPHGPPAALDIHLSPEALHFGVDLDEGDASFTKGSAANQPFRGDGLRLVIGMDALATALGVEPQTFARDMIEGVPVARFAFQPGVQS